MRRFWLISLVVALAVLLTLPAFAEHDIGGFIRIKGWVSNFGPNAGYIEGYNTSLKNQLSKDPSTTSFVEERARLKFKFKGNEYVTGIAYFELDQDWGGSAYTNGRNVGGALEADTTNLETKNLYIDFRVPDTTLALRAGVQNVTDAYAGTIVGVADMAGVFGTYKIDPVSFRFGWAKWWENDRTQADDVDFYLLEGKFTPVENFKLGLNLYLIKDGVGADGYVDKREKGTGGGTIPVGQRGPALAWTPAEIDVRGKASLYYVGFDASYKLDVATISGFFFYNFGTFDKAALGGTKDLDVGGFAADLRADAKLGPGKGFIELLYVSGDDNPNDDSYDSILTASNYNLAASFYYRMDTQILLPNGDDINSSPALAYDVANKGRGLLAVAAGYSMKLTDDLTGKIGVGYMQDAEKDYANTDPFGGTVRKAGQEASAFEINAKVNYQITKGLTFGLYGAYASLSDYYAGSTADEADDLYMTYARLQLKF